MDKKSVVILLVLSVSITLGLSLSVQSLLAAWVSPTAVPPTANVAAPLNVGSVAQTKTGALTIDGLTKTNGGLKIETVAPTGAPLGTLEAGRMWLIN
jgi:hypothetical protein